MGLYKLMAGFCGAAERVYDIELKYWSAIARYQRWALSLEITRFSTVLLCTLQVFGLYFQMRTKK